LHAQCLEDWQFYRNITIQNPSATQALAAGPASFILDTDALVQSSKLREDGFDMRLVNNNCEAVDFYVDTAFTSTENRIWLSLPAIPAGGSLSMRLYYGRPDADSSVVNGDAIFTFIDDFTADTLNTQKWETIGEYAELSISDGILTYSSTLNQTSNSRFKFMRSKMSFSDSMWVDMAVWQTNASHYGFSSADSLLERFLLRYISGANDTIGIIAVINDSLSNGYATVTNWPLMYIPRSKMNHLRLKVYINADNKLYIKEIHNLTHGITSSSGHVLEPFEMSGWHFILSSFSQGQKVKLDYVRMWPVNGNDTSAVFALDAEVMQAGGSNAIDRMLPVLSVHPNPVTDQLLLPNIRHDEGYLTDLFGRKVLAWSGQKEGLDVGDIPAGIYVLHLLDRGVVLGQARVVKR
ncbi:MAG: DUF2341 domain-containing protein, partial [Bacteroidia bacterium]|nr:DUF2341 domain-containing protein [Bacteroidia bacterium]